MKTKFFRAALACFLSVTVASTVAGKPHIKAAKPHGGDPTLHRDVLPLAKSPYQCSFMTYADFNGLNAPDVVTDPPFAVEPLDPEKAAGRKPFEKNGVQWFITRDNGVFRVVAREATEGATEGKILADSSTPDGFPLRIELWGKTVDLNCSPPRSALKTACEKESESAKDNETFYRCQFKDGDTYQVAAEDYANPLSNRIVIHKPGMNWYLSRTGRFRVEAWETEEIKTATGTLVTRDVKKILTESTNDGFPLNATIPGSKSSLECRPPKGALSKALESKLASRHPHGGGAPFNRVKQLDANLFSLDGTGGILPLGGLLAPRNLDRLKPPSQPTTNPPLKAPKEK